MSVFNNLEKSPQDPIFGLCTSFNKDPNPYKIDLLVGTYRNEQLETPVFSSVKEAEKLLIANDLDKKYLPIRGDDVFIQESQKLIFGDSIYQKIHDQLCGIQSLGGTGALWLAGSYIFNNLSKDIYIPEPTWPNHLSIFKSCGLNIHKYKHYDSDVHAVDFDNIVTTMNQAPKNSVFVFHVCCHNPTGCDFSHSQWMDISKSMKKNQLIPLFDFAYQGFKGELDEDAWPVRFFASEGHELFVAKSYSKTFGLYGERIGSLSVLLKHSINKENVTDYLKKLVRTSYSNPSRHGSSIVSTVLQNPSLSDMWKNELKEMRSRCNYMRNLLRNSLKEVSPENRFNFFNNCHGLFVILGLNKQQVEKIRNEYGVYMTNNSRINISGVSESNVSYISSSISKVLE